MDSVLPRSLHLVLKLRVHPKWYKHNFCSVHHHCRLIFPHFLIPYGVSFFFFLCLNTYLYGVSGAGETKRITWGVVTCWAVEVGLNSEGWPQWCNHFSSSVDKCFFLLMIAYCLVPAMSHSSEVTSLKRIFFSSYVSMDHFLCLYRNRFETYYLYSILQLHVPHIWHFALYWYLSFFITDTGSQMFLLLINVMLLKDRPCSYPHGFSWIVGFWFQSIVLIHRLGICCFSVKLRHEFDVACRPAV